MVVLPSGQAQVCKTCHGSSILPATSISLSCESKDSTLEGRYLTTELLPPNDNPESLVIRCTCSRSALKAGDCFLEMKINYVSLCSGYGAEDK